MATELLAQKINGRLVPETMSDVQAFDDLSTGVTYRVKLTRAAGRSVKHHRLLFALIGIAVDNYDGAITADAVLDVLKLETGHVNVIKAASGQVFLTPKSIAFAKMDQDAFNKWFAKAVDVICRDFVPGLAAELAMREVDRRAAGQPANDDQPYRRAA